MSVATTFRVSEAMSYINVFRALWLWKNTDFIISLDLAQKISSLQQEKGEDS